MRVHEYTGDGFCTVPIDGIPCLGSQMDSTIHVMPFGGATNHAVDRTRWAITPWGTAGTYIVLRDFQVARRAPLYATKDLNDAVRSLEANKTAHPQDAVWIERIG